MKTIHDKRVEAAAEGMWNLYGDRGMFTHAPEHLRNGFMKDARAALLAADAVCCAHPKCPGGSLCCCQADAVVTEEMIAETILKALVFTNENSKPWADGLARDIAALFRGGAK